jgi:hypothetical protein
MLESVESENEKIVGVDFFIESNEQPVDIANKCLRHAGVKFKLVNISNRGTQVWPTVLFIPILLINATYVLKASMTFRLTSRMFSALCKYERNLKYAPRSYC